MSAAAAVTVQSAIVHVADRNQSTPLCSDLELNLGASSVLHDYFNEQVQNALDDDTSAAKFSAGSAAKNACDAIFAKPANFVAASQELARLMHAAMQTHARIASGTLAVCTYTKGSGADLHLALMKLDPGSALVQKVDRNRGKTLITFDVQGDVMPSAREKIHKAALLPPPGTKKFDLMLLDTQTAEPAARWWTSTFLNATLVIDGRLGADEFNRANDRARRALDSLGKHEEAEVVLEQARAAMRSNRVQVSPYVLSLPEEAREIVRKELGKKLGDARSIPIDPEYAAEMVKTTRYRGKYGFILEFEAQHETTMKFKKWTTQKNDEEITHFEFEVPGVQRVK